MLRRIKIAVSALSLMACVALVFLWVRSHRIEDVAYYPVSSSFWAVQSSSGVIELSIFTTRFRLIGEWRSRPMADDDEEWGPAKAWTTDWDDETWAVTFPYWFPVAMTGFAAVAPWILTHFNLKTMLLVTTFAAVVMGAIAYQARQ
jgi:hypothetical protein